MALVPAIGFAVADKDGNILLRTLFDTQRGAKVNWLTDYAECLVTAAWSDQQIAETFALQSRDAGAQLIRVRVLPEHAP